MEGNIKLFVFDIPKKGVKGERSHSQSDTPEEWSLQQHSDSVLCLSRPEEKSLYQSGPDMMRIRQGY